MRCLGLAIVFIVLGLAEHSTASPHFGPHAGKNGATPERPVRQSNVEYQGGMRRSFQASAPRHPGRSAKPRWLTRLPPRDLQSIRIVPYLSTEVDISKPAAYSTYIQKLTNEAATWLGSALTVASSAVPPARASDPAYVAHAGATREQQPQV